MWRASHYAIAPIFHCHGAGSAMKNLSTFNDGQIKIVNESAAMAEDLVHNHYKMSTSQWLRLRYDIKTLTDLVGDEIVFGRFAQVVRYEGKPHDRNLGSSA